MLSEGSENTGSNNLELPLQRNWGSTVEYKRERPLQRNWGSDNTYGSFDWITTENQMRQDKFYRTDPTRLRFMRKAEWRIEATRWMLCFIIGIIMGTTGFLINLIIYYVSELKFTYILDEIQESCRNSYSQDDINDAINDDEQSEGFGCKAGSWIVATIINVPLVLVATYVCYKYAPASAGSGIGEVKCYLNGVKRHGWMDTSTLGSKIFGMICLCCANMPIGKEGPMIHVGAIFGAAVAQGRIRWGGTTWDSPIHWFRNDRSKRDFVSCGAAAGLATAFGASLGGVLFVLEEGASFPSQALVWRSLFSATVALFMLQTLTAYGPQNDGSGNVGNYGMFSFGSFPNADGISCRPAQTNETNADYLDGDAICTKEDPLWKLAEIPIFCVIGVIGGLLGAVWNQAQTHLTRFRLKWRKTGSWCYKEAMAIAFVNTALLYLMAQYVDTCKPLCTASNEALKTNLLCPPGTPTIPDWMRPSMRQGTCDDGYYSTLASLIFNELGIAVRKFFHLPLGGFSFVTCFLFFCVSFGMSCWTYGGMYPSGLFVPSIAAGAALGRYTAEVLHLWGYDLSYGGTYAVMGAAAVLGGITRVTISLTAIFCEATNQVTYVLPITLVLIISKFVADSFNSGIYDIHIKLKKIPFLEWSPDTSIRRYTCDDAMSTALTTLPVHAEVGDVIEVLQTTQHNGFLIVSGESDESDAGKFEGLILRHQLYTLLVYKQWGKRSTSGPMLTAEQFDTEVKLDIDSENIKIARSDYDQIMDLSPYYDTSPTTALPLTPLSRAYDLFRYQGLRHLPVVRRDGQLVGLLTRHDIDEHAIDELNHHHFQSGDSMI